MRRSLAFTVLFGVLTALLSAVPASADGSCDGAFPARLGCWSGPLGRDTVTITLDHALALDGSRSDRDKVIALAAKQRGHLEVQVPAGVSTGEGGTVLLVLAAHRLVHPEARIDRLSRETVKELTDNALCTGTNKDLCELVGPGKQGLTGQALIDKKQATGHFGYVADTPGGRDGPETWLLFATATLLVLLLAALVYAVRRSRAPRAVLAAPGIGPLPATDDPSARLRTTASRTAARTGPARSALVRTELHPQGYVELDRVLYRAVWAQPGRPAPAPGSHVDVTDPAETDSDVLYAFPPAAGRHAHAHAR
ncbi:hypothetical protein [Streptomyces sp. NPDC047043]|uniref:hypothetical protein n=1 Tax=Streptomyces sp. NPDC047043 TaxID=3154497 RepID=UPI0033E26A64